MNFIDRDQLARHLDAIAQSQTLLAPCDVDGMLLYRPVKDSSWIAWDFDRPVMSIKEALFPQTDRLMQISHGGNGVQILETLPAEKQVLFGVRPCDAKGLKVLDAMFLDTAPVDPYYAQRRALSTVIGVACDTIGPSCFCTSMDSGPHDASAVDVMLYPVQDGYLVEAQNEKGWAFLQGLEVEATTQVPPPPQPPAPVRKPSSQAWPALYDHPLWAEQSERCLSCRICAYVCPTCRCFDVRDEPLMQESGGNQLERIRVWDSCARESYREIAGGHNPRLEKAQRMRNRIFCKFYYYPQQYGLTACTGCGRCIDLCPVNIDISEVLESLAAVQGGGGL